MLVEIRKRVFGGYKAQTNCDSPWHRTEGYTVYVVVRDGRRIDSFLKKRNARRCAKQLAGAGPLPPHPECN